MSGYTVRKLLIFLAVITVLKLYRGLHAEVFRTEVVVKSAIFFQVVQEKSVCVGGERRKMQMWQNINC